MKKKKVILLIIDGWGLTEPNKFNAIDNAKTPNMDKLIREYPNTRLLSDGLNVGLPEGQSGTSEVNHMTIGAGRIILQDLPKINKHIEAGTFRENPVFHNSVEHAKSKEGDMHLVGILSDGGVHAHMEHLFEILRMLNDKKFSNQIYLHLFSDGRDTPPKSAEGYFKALEKVIKSLPKLNIVIATYQGRFYLDRDRDWEKTESAFQLIANAKGAHYKSWETILNYEYNHQNTDEYFTQYVLSEEGKMKSGDSVIFYHYRTDRLFQLVKRLVDQKIKDLDITTFIEVSESFKKVNVAFPRDRYINTLSECIADKGKKQIHVTETEKFPHLTFFFNGEKEEELAGETWKMFESNRFVKPHYGFEPSMQNFRTAKYIMDQIEEGSFDFLVSNLCTPDMVGHTGNYEAAVVSAESIDYCVGKIFEKVEENFKEYALVITADHGNSEEMWDYENDQPHTRHTLNPVPFILVSDLDAKLHRRESLQDIAPTILDLMGIKAPEEMEGESLIISK